MALYRDNTRGREHYDSKLAVDAKVSKVKNPFVSYIWNSRRKKRKKPMSAELWNNIQRAIVEIAPEKLEAFNKCRDRDSICKFLEKHFPLTDKMVCGDTSWSTQLMSRTPDILKDNWGKKK